MREMRERSEPRQPLHLPLRFRVLDEEKSDLVSSETANISPCGLFMHTRARLKIGTVLSLSLRIPTTISGSYRFYFHCTGRVIHERLYPGGYHGYGVQFEKALSAGQISSRPEESVYVPVRESAGKFVEKRRNLRRLLKIPVRVRCLEEGFPNFEVRAETLNVSQHGAFLTSSIPLEIGSSLNLSMLLALPSSGNSPGTKQSRARVIHEQSFADGTVGYGVEIEQVLAQMTNPDSEAIEEVPIAWS